MEDRLIVLYDDDTNFLVRTDAPEEIIEETIEYKNEKLQKRIYFILDSTCSYCDCFRSNSIQFLYEFIETNQKLRKIYP